ncbi:MAG: phosphate/phosphite/phosphonate ABC transporter substrate-binding protein [Thermoguttaceae bacterium]|nr:phosphate/phosphite/phosphonate ABC transporter substrate-binding protein [Thermoguttaceae bacterium]MDW8036588.1 phosphate/phosphite/phosphonate ABC transporter substrate-binding protein [Thermoguttaceae bacterium]
MEASTVGSAASASTERILRVGSVSKSPKKEISTFKPLQKYLAEALRPYGVARCEVVVASSVEEMAAKMQNGEVDIYIDSPWPVLRVCQLSGAIPILRRWKGGEADYRAVIFTRKESGLTEIKQLTGRVIALDEPVSTSGCLLPLGALAAAGIRLRPLEDASAAVPADQVGYVFTGDEENVFFWVLRGKAVAGAMLEAKFLQYTAASPEEFKVILYTDRVPRHIVCQRRDLEPAMAAAVREVLVGMTESESGRTALRKFQNTAKFDQFPGGADAALQPVHRSMELLQALGLP